MTEHVQHTFRDHCPNIQRPLNLHTHTPNETLSEVHQLVGKQDIQDTEASSQS